LLAPIIFLFIYAGLEAKGFSGLESKNPDMGWFAAMACFTSLVIYTALRVYIRKASGGKNGISATNFREEPSTAADFKKG
jgi:hypothetical protein